MAKEDSGNVLLASLDSKTYHPKGVLVDRSGTASSSSSTLMPANEDRSYLFIQNVSAGTIWINFTSDATASSPSIALGPGATYTLGTSFITTEKITVIRAGILDLSYTAKEG